MTTQLSDIFVGTSLSSGTMKTDDLYFAFIDFLEDHDLDTAAQIKEDYADVIDQIESGIDEAQETGKIYYHSYVEGEEFLIESLFDALNEIAPDGCYFGSHPGDGADYGFWQSEEEYF